MQKEKDGRLYYTFEFASKASNYIRHALAVVTVGNGELSICKAREALLLYQICSIPNMGMGSAFAVGIQVPTSTQPVLACVRHAHAPLTRAVSSQASFTHWQRGQMRGAGAR